VTVTSIPAQTIDIPQPDGPDLPVTIASPSIAATELILKPTIDAVLAASPDRLTLLFSFVDGGQPTNVGRTELGATELGDPDGIAVEGIVTPPPDAIAAAEAAGLTQATNVTGELEQEFLLSDALQVGALVEGRLTFTSDGRATFEVLAADQLPPVALRLPITVYGNVVTTTRGESVFGEVLGNGNARLPNQRFKLRKKPLTYLPLASGTAAAASTLQIRVDGVLWREVPTFFGQSPEDTVYTARHDDEQNTIVTFGDGVRGARLPSGVKNVVASYRFGAGEAAPPAGTISQLARSVKGLRGVRAPVAATPGKDPDKPEELRTNAPRSALLFGRAVSAADFEALAREQPGVIQARAEWLWIAAQMQAGVEVHYLGGADATAIATALRSQADPSVPIEVTRATAIPTTVSIGIEVDPRDAPAAVASAVQAHLTRPGTGVLSLEQARVGGTFWPSVLFEAISQVPGAVAVTGLTFTTAAGGPAITNAGGTCIETGKYLDFSAAGSVTVTGVQAIGVQA
jgi:predicted phage baseplate assembly protein